MVRLREVYTQSRMDVQAENIRDCGLPNPSRFTALRRKLSPAQIQELERVLRLLTPNEPPSLPCDEQRPLCHPGEDEGTSRQ